MPDSREHPILFTPAMVRAILDGRKLPWVWVVEFSRMEGKA